MTERSAFAPVADAERLVRGFPCGAWEPEFGGDWCLVVPLVFKTSEGLARVPGGFDSHSPPPFFCDGIEKLFRIVERKHNFTMKKPQRFLSMRPSRWSVFGFRFIPLLLFAVGTCAILYGGFFHRLPVTETHDEEITVAEPIAPEMPPGMLPGMPPGMGPNEPFGPPSVPGEEEPPPVKFVTKIKTVETTANELEWNVNELMTVGGIALNQQGGLVRLASGNEGPAFCPT